MTDNQSVSSRPAVSVVTPSFNQAAYLEATILSVLSQDYPNIEYLVVDGGSTDGSLEIIQRYAARLAGWVSEPDHGQAHAINKGWSSSTGDILAWLNSDDMYTPGAVATAVEAFERMPRVDLIYSDCLLLDEITGASRRRKARQQDLVSLLLDGDHIPQPTVFLRRSLLEKTGFLEQSLQLTLDYHLWLRAAGLGRLQYLPDACLATMRLHAEAKSYAQFLRFTDELVKTLDLFYAQPDVPRASRNVRGRAYASWYYARSDIAFSVHHQYPESVLWLARALLLHPPLLARLPRALWRILVGRHSPPSPEGMA